MIRPGNKPELLHKVLAGLNDGFKPSEQPDFMNNAGSEKLVAPPDNMQTRTPSLQSRVADKERKVAAEAEDAKIKTLDLNHLYTTMAYLKDDQKDSPLDEEIDPKDWNYARRGEAVIQLYENELRRQFPSFANKLVANLGLDKKAWMDLFVDASKPSWFKAFPYPTDCLVELAKLLQIGAPKGVKVPPYIQALARMTDYAVSTLK